MAKSTIGLLVKAAFKPAHHGLGDQHQSFSLPDRMLRESMGMTRRSHQHKYHRLTHWTGREFGHIHPCYWHLRAFPQHLMLMTSPDFPFKIVGLVHLSNTIEQLQPFECSDNTAMQSQFTRLAPHPKGWTFVINSQIIEQDQILWQSESQFLARTKSGASSTQASDPSNETEPMSWTNSQRWQIKSADVRGYARVSGDFNPIHLSAVTARWFGFRQAIAHGMLTKARCISALAADSAAHLPATFTVEFIKPLYVPNQVEFAWRNTASGFQFEVHSESKEVVHLSGQLSLP